MKINPIGVQAYQQIARREQNNPAPTEKKQTTAQESVLNIAPREITERSELAVKAPAGSYADFLTPEERSALELLFNRFNNTERFGPGYQAESNTENRSGHVGRLIDVKV